MQRQIYNQAFPAPNSRSRPFATAGFLKFLKFLFLNLKEIYKKFFVQLTITYFCTTGFVRVNHVLIIPKLMPLLVVNPTIIFFLFVLIVNQYQNIMWNFVQTRQHFSVKSVYFYLFHSYLTYSMLNWGKTDKNTLTITFTRLRQFTIITQCLLLRKITVYS